MARAAETYRGARRNAVRPAFWTMTTIGFIASRPYRWVTAMAPRPGKPIWTKPHQGTREKARRRRQMDGGQLTGIGVIPPLSALRF